MAKRLNYSSVSENIDNPVKGILTNTEFDTLSEEEKNKGTYFLSDGTNGPNQDNQSNQDNYLTDQFKIVSNGKTLEVSGNNSTNCTTNAPIGAILAWSGTEDTVPEGWHICNGEDGTVDLRDKFVLGAGINHSVGETGGSEEVTLTVAQMPSHSHRETYITTDPSSTSKWVSLQSVNVTSDNRFDTTMTGADTLNTGESNPHPNMPPYYALLYIQKVSVAASDGEVYSTEERCIGTWINGKPIYRKVIDITMGVLNVETIHTTLDYVDFVVSNRFVVFGKAGSYIEFPNMLGYIFFSSVKKALGSLTTSNDMAGQPAKAIIEYTKTTDQEVNT